MSSIDNPDQLYTIAGQSNVVEPLPPPDNDRSATMLEESIVDSTCSSLNNTNNSFLSINETPPRLLNKNILSAMSSTEDSIETVNNSELFVEMDTELILTPKSTKKLHEMSGRRVVDIFTFIRDIQNYLCDHGPLFGCSFKDMDIISEKKNWFTKFHQL